MPPVKVLIIEAKRTKTQSYDNWLEINILQELIDPCWHAQNYNNNLRKPKRPTNSNPMLEFV